MPSSPWPSQVRTSPCCTTMRSSFGLSASARCWWKTALSRLLRVCDWLEAQGLLETTYLVLISDHGMVDVRPDGYINLMKLVRKDWRRNATDTMDQDDPYNPRRRFFDRFDTAVAYQDGRKAFLYFAGPSGWDEAPNPATVAQILAAPPAEKQLWNLPGIDLVEYLAAENEAIIRSPRGEARVVERRTPNGPEYHYLPGPDDPLGYLDDPKLGKFVAAGFHDSRAWLHATAAHEFPDLVPHIVPLLRNPRAGQVIVSTAPGYSFTHEPGGHGGARRVEMRVPFMFAGPGIKPGGTLECACSVDLVPTLLVLLGRDPPNDGSLEGIPLFADIHARPATMRMPR
jgi:arylsulfatase A-like enzyme